MKFSKGILILSVALLAFGACKKDDANKEIAGTWEGSWGFDLENPTYYERWEIKKNGDLVAYDEDGDVYANGSWNVDGLNFEAEYTSEVSGNEYRFEGLYHDALKEIVGTWGNSPSTADGGTFEMYKN